MLNQESSLVPRPLPSFLLCSFVQPKAALRPGNKFKATRNQLDENFVEHAVTTPSNNQKVFMQVLGPTNRGW